MAVSLGGDILRVLQESARKGTLLSSCEPEVKELMYQLNLLISSRCQEWEAKVVHITAQLQDRQNEVDHLQATLQQKTVEIEKLVCRSCQQEREFHTHCADYEAQLLRLRSEFTRMAQNYQKLREKRYQKTHQGGGCSMQVKQLLDELDKTKSHLQVCREELKRKEAMLSEVLQSQDIRGKLKAVPDIMESDVTAASLVANRTIEQFAQQVDQLLKTEPVKEDFPVLPVTSQSTSELVDELLQQHLQQLSENLIQVLDTTAS